MTFVWKTTCRRLQSSGGLARFAEGLATERESREIETHLAACPSCQAIVVETLAVADLLRASVPSAPAKSLAASGNLWKTLEREIVRTPQDRVLIQQSSVPEPVSTPRLQRFGRWLSMPGAMPFGAATAAAVVGMVGIVAYHQLGPSPVEKQTASVSSAVGDSEFTILPSPGAPASMAAGTAATINEPVRQPLVQGRTSITLAPRAVAAIKTDAIDNEIAILKTNPSVRRSRSLAIPAPLPFSVASLRPAAPRSPAARMAKAAAPESFAADTAAPASSAKTAQVATAEKPGGFGDGIGGSGGNPTAYDFVASNDADNTRLVPPASAIVARARAVPAPAPVVQGAVALASVYGNRDSLSEEVQEVPAARSLLDMALRQRRQRSLFSYATR